MIQPLFGDLLTGTILHGFLDIIAGYIGEQAVYPYTYLILVLLLKLSLTVDGPAHEPLGILAAYNTAGYDLTASGVTLTDIGDIRNDLVIQCGHGSGFPVSLGDIGTELLGMSEGRILFCDIFPQAPYAAGTNLCIPVGCMVLVTVDGTLGTASVGNEYQVVLGEDNALLYTFYLALDSLCHLFAVIDIKNNICHFGVELEVHTCCLQILLHGKDQRLVLVVLGELQGTEVRQSGNMMDESLEVKLHFQCAVPVLESEHGSPV